MGNWFTGNDPEKYKADPNASAMGNSHGATDFAQGQLGHQAPTSTAAQLDQTAANQSRGQLQGLAGQLSSTAQGAGPSAAGVAGQQARDAALSQASALQAGRRGGNAAVGARMATNAAAMGQQATQGQETAGRINEMTTARGQLGNILSGMRGQDLGAAEANAGYQQQTGLANQSANLQQQGLNLNAAGQLQGQSQAEMNARMEQEKMKYGNLDPGSGGVLGGAIDVGTKLGAAALVSDRNAKSDIQQVGGSGQLMGIGQRIMPVASHWYDRASAGLQRGANTIADAVLAHELEKKDKETADTKKQKADADARQNALDMKQLTTPITPGQLKYDTDLSNNYGVTISDEKSKSEARNMLGNLTPYSYNYKQDAKDAGMPEGRQLGVMAQDLEKSKAGSAMVGRDEQTGYKDVDYLKGLPTMMAGLADQEARLRKLEGKRRKS